MPHSALKTTVHQQISAHRTELVTLSRRLHAHPETAFEERQASTWCAETLRAAGFTTTVGVHGLETAFDARIGSGDTHVAFVCEYDALPDLGHACGHNLIAMAGIAAAIGAAAVADECGLSIRVLGTPAEERGAGKALMLDAGAFDGLDAALMVHPCPFDLDDFRSFALGTLDVTFHGRAAHASLAPHEGRNAADALTIAQVALGLLRGQLPSAWKVHGVATSAGGAPNQVPATATASYELRCERADDLIELRRRVEDCFRGAALATGCTVDLVRPEPDYLEMRSHPGLLEAWRANSVALGRESGPSRAPFAITDMGNVSHTLAAIHPVIDIQAGDAAPHEAAFAEHADTDAAHDAFLRAATAMAWTAVDIGLDRDGVLGSASRP